MSNSASQQTREDILDSALRIKQLTQQPSDFLTELLIQQQQFICIEWICRFKVFEAVPLPPDSISYSDAATKLNVSSSTLRSTLRMAMTANLFTETTDGKLAHNSLSASFVQNEDLKTWLNYNVFAAVPTMRAYPDATAKWPGSKVPNETAYNVWKGTELPFFGHIKANPELGAEFNKFMASQGTAHEGASLEHLFNGFDWASLGDAKVVDVGGNNGGISVALAERFPRLKFVVQDLAGPIQEGRTNAESLPKEIAERIEFQEQSFLDPQPVKDADVYFLRMIIHNWNDDDSVKILKGLADSMKPSGRIIIQDMLLPAPGTGSRTHEASLREKDLMMRQVFNSKEREVEDLNALLAQVDEKLRIVGVVRPKGSQHSVIEIARPEA
ncbi:methyltransferase [Byssothecium circinans]|uniref:Methyltransferase n=1 Tax=Byssothecium circinans TaxID=147558 RepID=A0A6A5U9P2_9PLEO|nr:methyltransferase [Byssothecium circinans]